MSYRTRLTAADRQEIAEGLARGIGYAEIARRLARPTSTVSREVLRNGGPNRYQPQRAQRATEQRARRHKRPAEPAATGGPDDIATREYLDRLSALITQTGLPRTAAKVMATLYADNAPGLTAADLAQRLQVSPATVSAAVVLLETQGLIRRERNASGRRDRYLIDDDAWVRATLASARQVHLLAEAAHQGIAVFGAATPAGSRLGTMSEFLTFVGHDMVASAERWRQLLGGNEPGGSTDS
ncbi:helix-turn-helix domain-containing protein [Nocardia flavorosea]|uniref:Helix-turn-helix domain-containing protein n=1 Tax=Nocardia flavorosea TaxID=53429 RepID=A0A846YLX4_9NOCA|nr:helix-turn-helix domain-containing protein [Nocardia flavorosea]